MSVFARVLLIIAIGMLGHSLWMGNTEFAVFYAFLSAVIYTISLLHQEIQQLKKHNAYLLTTVDELREKLGIDRGHL